MEKLTKEIAKYYSMEKWQFLCDNPVEFFVGVFGGCNLPRQLKDEIAKYSEEFYCLLCELYNDGLDNCKNECPFVKVNQHCTAIKNSYYNMWKKSRTLEERKKYAAKILQVIEDWEI